MQKFESSKTALKVLQSGNILWDNETPEQMIDRICFSIREIELKYFKNDQDETSVFSKKIERLLYQKKIVPSTPILTNLGRISEYPLSACVVPDIDLRGNRELMKQRIDKLHLEWMWTWFNFTWLDNPIDLIFYLNSIAKELQDSGKQNRPVGNMWVMSVYDKHIFDFIKLKQNWIQQWIDRKFNFSIDVDQNFINALECDLPVQLNDWTKVQAQTIFDEMCKYAHISADPWVIRLDKMNESNLMSKVSPYTATAPCWEVWLSAWEACQFASVNLSEIVDELWSLNYEELKNIVFDLVRFLDDCLEYSISHYSDWSVQAVMNTKRKIGVWVCWFADLLIKLKIVYWSPESVQLAKNLMSYINYYSKISSIELAKQRWSFPGMQFSLLRDDNLYFSKKYWNGWSKVISLEQWEKLDDLIDLNWIRHISTTALPPTWRSSIVFDTSQQIEPLFNLRDYDGNIRSDLMGCLWKDDEKINQVNELWTCQNIDFENSDTFKISQEIPPLDHMKILLWFQEYTDEAVSKTINMPGESTIDDIKGIYLEAFKSWLKWITIYRDWSRNNQPINLS